MEAMILKFVASARAAGMRISTAETLDCLSQLPRVDVLDENQFATVLRANFAKSRLERARFDHLYQLFFHEIREDLDPASATLAGHMETIQQDPPGARTADAGHGGHRGIPGGRAGRLSEDSASDAIRRQHCCRRPPGGGIQPGQSGAAPARTTRLAPGPRDGG